MPCSRKEKIKRGKVLYCNDEVLYIGGIPGEGSEEDQENIGKGSLDRGGGVARSESVQVGCGVHLQGLLRTALWILPGRPPLTRALEEP